MNTPRFDTIECTRIRLQLNEYISGELPPENSTGVTKHLEICEPCSRELERRIQVRNSLRRAFKALPVPGSLAAKVRGQLSDPKPSFFWLHNVNRLAVALPGLAILVVAFLTTGL